MVLYYKHITIVNYNSIIVNKFGASLTDDAIVVIYDRHMFIVQATRVLFTKLFVHRNLRMVPISESVTLYKA